MSNPINPTNTGALCATQGESLRAAVPVNQQRPTLPMNLSEPLSEAEWAALRFGAGYPSALLHRLVWTQAIMIEVLRKVDPVVWNAAVRDVWERDGRTLEMVA